MTWFATWPLDPARVAMAALFDSEFLVRLEYLALVAKRIVRGELRAERLTTKRGSGVESGIEPSFRG